MKSSLSKGLLLALGFSATIVAATVEPSELAGMRAKALRGNVLAQYNLGRCYSDASSGVFDRAEAYAWLKLAAENGTGSVELTRLSEQMSPAELAEASRRFEERRPQIKNVLESGSAVAVNSDAVAAAQAERDQLAASLSAATMELAQLRAAQAQAGSPEKLRSDLIKLETELNETRAMARQLATKNMQLEDVASERGRDLAAVKSELEQAKTAAPKTASAEVTVALTAERDLLQKQLKDVQDELRKAKADNDRVERVERDVALLRGQNERLQAEQAHAQAAAGEVARLTKQLEDLRSQAVQPVAASEGSAELKKQLADLEAKLATAEREDSARQKGWALERETAVQAQAEFEGRLSTLQASNAASATQLQEALAELKAKEAQLALAKTVRTPAVASDAPAALVAERDSLQKSLREALDELGKARIAAERSATVEREVATLKAQNSLLQAEQARAHAAVDESAGLTKQLEQLRAQQVQAAGGSEAVADLKSQLAESEAKLATALRSFSLQQQEADQGREAATRVQTDLEGRLNTALASNTALNTQLQDALAEIKTRDALVSEANKEAGLARQNSLSSSSEVSALRDQLRQTQLQLVQVVEENSHLKTKLAVIAPPPASTLGSPIRPGTAAAQAAITLPPAIAQKPVQASKAVVAPEQRTHIIAEGDSLSKISRKYYGTSERWNEIYEANRNILNNPGRLPTGAMLRIP